MLDWTGWANPYAVAFIMVHLNTILLLWLVPSEFVNE